MQADKKFCNLQNLSIIKSLFIVETSLFLMSQFELVGEMQEKYVHLSSCVSSRHVLFICLYQSSLQYEFSTG
jgi:hypothetical protein